MMGSLTVRVLALVACANSIDYDGTSPGAVSFFTSLARARVNMNSGQVPIMNPSLVMADRSAAAFLSRAMRPTRLRSGAR